MKKEIKKTKDNYKTLTSYIHKDSRDFKAELEKAKKHLSKNDKVLKSLIKNSGDCSIKPHKGYFETLVKSIVSQQLSVKAAASIFKKFKLLFGDGDYFPTTEEIIAMTDDRLRG